MIVKLAGGLLLLLLLAACAFQSSQAVAPLEQTLKFDPTTNSYSGLTFTFEPQLDKQVQERLHFDHWLAIVQHTSSLMYEALNGRAHLNELRVLIPYKWRQLGTGWPMLHKPGSPIISNRRLRHADADVLVGSEDPVYKETPFALQHDECGRPGLQIKMPIGFLEPAPARGSQAGDEARLKGRQLLREFASHRYGVFKESGFRADFMYPPFTSVPGLPAANWTYRSLADLSEVRNLTGLKRATRQQQQQQQESLEEPAAEEIRGFDQNLRECKFESSVASGLPLAQAATCAPYLVRAPSTQQSFNLMGADLFTHATRENSEPTGEPQPPQAAPLRPIEWNEQLAELTTWHFCGENFPPLAQPADGGANLETASSSSRKSALTKSLHFGHNERASTKQNKMCQERSALDVIRASDDFRSAQFSPSSFNRLPAPSFKFLQEMPPRLIMGFEYTTHLFQSRRLDHAMLVAAVNKLLALDLIADSEIATVMFGQHQARILHSFQRLEASLSSRFALFNPAIDPFDEQPQLYSQHELLQLGVQPQPSDSAASAAQAPLKLLKGSCSFARLMGELNQLLARSGSQYEDADADVVLLTSGLFVEDEQKIEDLIRSSNFKQAQNRLDLVIYPSGMLFDTKSRDGYIVLDSRESELIIKSRVNKLLLIERLTGARIHLIREQLDASGDFKMSTLTQFYQVFERLAKGHSWDQTDSMMLLASQQNDSRQIWISQQRHQPAAAAAAASGESQAQAPQQQHSLSFSFELDDSIQNELLVGFIDPRVAQHQQLGQPQLFGQPQLRAGKRFQLKNLQLRSPGGHMLFTETGTYSFPAAFNRSGNELAEQPADELGEAARQQAGEPPAFFPHRAQLSLAAFHVRAWHLSQLQAAGHRLAGTWTLSAISDEPVQTSGIAMARTNPTGDSLNGHCWIQTYRSEPLDDQANASNSNALRQVKVFAQINGGARQFVQGRLEVQDEMGNIVQNVQMLDDGLGAPDITQNDGVLSQVVQRASRAGFYKVLVELALPHRQQKSSRSHSVGLPSGHDNVCCGSSIPSDRSPAFASGSSSTSRQSKLPTRQLYCGTFYVEPNNKLGQMRPPRVSNLTAVSVDQDNRRITLRWFEPLVELSPVSSQFATSSRPSTNSQLISIVSDNDLLSDETALDSASEQQAGRARRRMPPLTRVGTSASRLQVEAEQEQEDEEQSLRLKLDNVLIASHHQQRSKSASLLGEQLAPADAGQQQLWSRYEIKLFTDRDVLKRTFDAKHEVGFRFNEWNVEGQLPNASQFGGIKEVTLRVPFAREGFYFVAMKVYNAQGVSSQLSNIVQFYLRNNLTLEEVESIYNQPGATMDAEGNVYDKNGELIHQRGAGRQTLGSFSLFRGSNALDGWSVLVLLSLLVFIVTIMCLTLVACLASSARQSLAKKNKQSLISAGKSSGDDAKAAGTTISSLVSGAGRGCGSGSSMVSQSSGCGSSQHSEVGARSSQESPNFRQQQQHFHHNQVVDTIMQTSSELDLSKQMTTSYSQLQAQHKHQQQQAQLIHSHMISSYQQQQQQQEQEFYNSPVGYNQSQLPPTDWRQQQQQPLQHTLVNGFTYATVMPQSQQQHQLDATGHPLEQQQYQMFTGDLNQNGLGSATPNELHQSSATSGQYEHVKRQTVMRFGAPAAVDQLDGLPQVSEAQSSPPTGAKLPPNYLGHQQLQQQLSSVLKSKLQKREALEAGPAAESSSPALEGVRGEFDDGNISQLAYTSAEQMAPPPPHYIYCTAALDSNGLVAPAGHQQTLARDPSIYSKTTNLQQVSSGVHETNYYANHYDQPNGHWQTQAGPLNQAPQQADHSAAISEV